MAKAKSLAANCGENGARGYSPPVKSCEIASPNVAVHFGVTSHRSYSYLRSHFWTMSLGGCSKLIDHLRTVLPEACRFAIHHLSTPPTYCPPLYAAPPGGYTEETYCERQFLSVSIDFGGLQLQVYAIEVLIYSTEFLTTLFVSKADSTGYLHLLKLPSRTPSPLKTLSTAFLKYLIENRQRTDKRLVLSLFARAQNQYLFPGSIENSHKHVLDDRGLIKWWCKVIDPILELYENDVEAATEKGGGFAKIEYTVKSGGYIKVPGCDSHETKTFLPRHEHGRSPGNHRWHISDPLRGLGKSPDLPERCLIPRFPDDPKARFIEQLDEELPDQDDQLSSSQNQNREIPVSQTAGRWRSIHSLEQFWDTMSFRQECSSGRLVGFLWATFQPAQLLDQDKAINDEKRSHSPLQVALPTPQVSQNQDLPLKSRQSPIRSSPVPEPPLTPSKQKATPTPQTPAPTPQKTKEADIQRQPEENKHYYWPVSSRGEVVLREKDYQRVNNLLLRLDYANLEAASKSTKTWISDVAERGDIQTWGQEVVGTIPTINSDTKKSDTSPQMLSTGLIRKKKRPIDESNGHAAETGSGKDGQLANMLSAGLVRKKAKVTSTVGGAQIRLECNQKLAPG